MSISIALWLSSDFRVHMFPILIQETATKKIKVNESHFTKWFKILHFPLLCFRIN